METAVPSTLPSLSETESHESVKFPYFDYQFTVKSRKTGRLDTLDPILIDHDGDDAIKWQWVAKTMLSGDRDRE